MGRHCSESGLKQLSVDVFPTKGRQHRMDGPWKVADREVSFHTSVSDIP